MLSTKTKEAMLNALRYHITMRFYGLSAFGNWYAAKTERELISIGVFDPKPVNR
jgi:hypothetical protein